MPEILSSEAAARLGVSSATVRRLINKGMLPSKTVGTRGERVGFHLVDVRNLKPLKSALENPKPGIKARGSRPWRLFNQCGIGEMSKGTLLRLEDRISWHPGKSAEEVAASMMTGKFTPDTLEKRLKAVRDEIKWEEDNPPGWLAMLAYAVGDGMR